MDRCGDERGRFASDLTVLRLAEDRYRLITGTAQRIRDLWHVRRAAAGRAAGSRQTARSAHCAAHTHLALDLLEVGLDRVEDLAEAAQHAGRRFVEHSGFGPLRQCQIVRNIGTRIYHRGMIVCLDGGPHARGNG